MALNTMDKYLWKSLKIGFFSDNPDYRYKLLQYALNHGADPNIIHPREGFTPLMYTVLNNQAKMADLLIQKGADMHTVCQDTTALELAIELESHDCLDVLLKHKVNFHCHHINPLTYALKYHNMTALWRIEDAGADINEVSGEIKRTALMCAVLFEKDARYVYNLLQLHANPDIADIDGNTPLIAAISENSLEKVQLLIDAKADVNQQNNDKLSPLSFAAVFGNTQIIKELLDAGANPNTSDIDGNTPLHFVKNAESAQMLIHAGADKYAKNKEGATPFITAIDNQNSEVVHHFIQQEKMNVNALDNERNPLIVRAVLSGCNATVHSFIQAHANLNVYDRKGYTPLIYAISTNQHTLTNLLIKGGASIHLTDKKADEPIMHALYAQNAYAAQILLNQGANPNAYAYAGFPALMIATKQTPELLPLFIEKGAKIDAKDERGCTALMIAAESKDNKSVLTLLKAGANPNITCEDGRTFYDICHLGTKIACTTHHLKQKIQHLFNYQKQR